MTKIEQEVVILELGKMQQQIQNMQGMISGFVPVESHSHKPEFEEERDIVSGEDITPEVEVIQEDEIEITTKEEIEKE